MEQKIRIENVNGEWEDKGISRVLPFQSLEYLREKKEGMMKEE